MIYECDEFSFIDTLLDSMRVHLICLSNNTSLVLFLMETKNNSEWFLPTYNLLQPTSKVKKIINIPYRSKEHSLQYSQNITNKLSIESLIFSSLFFKRNKKQLTSNLICFSLTYQKSFLSYNRGKYGNCQRSEII